MEDHDSSVRWDDAAGIGAPIGPAFEIHAPVLDLPSPAADLVAVKITAYFIIYHAIEIVLIPGVLPGDGLDVVRAKVLPDIGQSSSVPDHDAAIHAPPSSAKVVTEITYGPKILGVQFQHPIEITHYDHIEVKIQQPALEVIGIEHLQLVPP